MKEIPLRNSLLILFFVAVAAVPLAWFTVNKPVRQISIVEARYLSTFPSPDLQSMKTGVKRILQRKPREAVNFILGKYLDRSYQKEFDAAASDQFPLRLPLILFARALDRKMIELAYSPLPDPAIPASMNSGIYIMRDGSWLISGPDIFNETSRSLVDKHIDNLDTLMKDHPDLHFYLFYLQRLVDSPYHPLNQYFPDADKGQMFLYFQANKPTGLTISSLTFPSLNDLMNSYYKTDHHWNILGIKKAYEGIYRMLAVKQPDISPELDLSNIHPLPQIEFWGSYARQTLYPLAGEEFEIAQIDLPPLDVSINKKSLTYVLRWEKALNNISNSKERYTNYYGLMYGNQIGVLNIDNKTGPTQNLLVIGSSFTRPLVPLLAAHYSHTYYIDLRQHNGFSLSEFIASHPVDDVLIVANDFVLNQDIWLIKP